MKLLEKIRAWKLKTFADWQWDILVGGGLALVALLIQVDWLVLVLPAAVTIINQIYNRIFEPRDFGLRMVVPVVIFLIIKIII